MNICFHGIGTPQRTLEEGEAPYWIDLDTYRRVLDVVAEDERVRITFDDGNITDLQHGLPELVERNLRATFFVLADRLDTPGSLGRSDLTELTEAGMRIGTHGAAHVPWRGLSPAKRHDELVRARVAIAEALGDRVTEAALPLGRYDRALLGHLRAAGYERVHTSDRTWADERAWLQPRFSIRSHDTAESVRTTMLGMSRAARLKRTGVIALKRLR